MDEFEVPIGRVKRDISELVNRVAYGGQRIVLTSRGKPKAALVSIDDLKQLQQHGREARSARWQAALEAGHLLADELAAARAGQPVDVDLLLAAAHDALEARDARYYRN